MVLTAYCPKCGTLLSPQDRFCPSCGTSTGTGGIGYAGPSVQAPAAADGSIDTLYTLTAVWGVLALIVGFGVPLIFYTIDSEVGTICLFVMSGLILSGIFALISASKLRTRTCHSHCFWCCILSAICAIGAPICFVVGLIIALRISDKKAYFSS